MPDFEFLPSIGESETVTCPRCKSTQYPRNGSCLKCRTPLELRYVSLRIDDLLNSESQILKEHLAQVIGTLLRSLRRRSGICQSQLTARASAYVTRTSLSKAECGRMLLPLYKLLPLAKALGLTAVILRFEGAASRASNQSTNRG